MKSILFVTLVVSTAVSGYGQAPATPTVTLPCTLKIEKSPVVRGIRLGMKLDEVLALFPGSRENEYVKPRLAQPAGYPNFGVMNIEILISQYSTKDRYDGISMFSFSFVDGGVAGYTVDYQEPPKWARVDDFISRIAGNFQLPPANDWTAVQYIPHRKTLKCAGFQIEASSNNSAGELRVSTLDSPAQIQRDRLKAFNEKKQREFKP